MILLRFFRLILSVLVFTLSGCDDGSDAVDTTGAQAAVDACASAATYRHAACAGQCSRFPDEQRAMHCEAQCADELDSADTLCAAPETARLVSCPGSDCSQGINHCRNTAHENFGTCTNQCAADNLHCLTRCRETRANEEESCGFLPVAVASGSVAIPALNRGAPASLPALLDDAEMAVVAAADERAETLRKRTVRLSIGAGQTPVSISQLEHGFRFGIPLDIREFEDQADRLAYYGTLAGPHASLLVAETSLKWRNVEREEGELNFDLAEAELAWAEEQGFDVKAHVLLWGNPPPLASGSGTPEWLRDRFPSTDLSPSEKTELRELIRDRIERRVSRYAGRIDVWEVTNEMLNPLTSWFVDRLGPEIVDDAFRWTRAVAPGAELVYNEWISDIFTGIGGPDATDVRDRVVALKEAGVPVDAVGQQGHFAPALVNVGVDVDLSERTRIDDYAEALDALAETGLPIHITEVTFAAPEEPEHRAAQAEAVMRLWWGHPQVEEIIFWNFWNPLGPRSHLNLGVFDEGGNPSRHGEAILALLNDRWRTNMEATTSSEGVVEISATLGDYIAQWQTPDGPKHIRFSVPRGPGTLQVIAVPE